MIHPSVAQRIAVIGGGIAGLSVAWLLSGRHKVTLFESDDRLGGHSHTLEVDTAGGTRAIDTGFVVYNERNYPSLVRLFRWLELPCQATDMSFAASLDGGRVEYAGTNLNTLFAQRANSLKPGFLAMLLGIVRFNGAAKRLLRQEPDATLSLGKFLARGRFGERLARDYLLPMTAAIWSCAPERMLDFPAVHLLRFLDNHGLLDVRERAQWLSIPGGSARYVRRMRAALEDVRMACPVTGVARCGDGVQVRTPQQPPRVFDAAILACHADESLALLEDPSPAQREVLGRFRYQPNRAVVHTDRRLMPRRRRVWSSWNYLTERGTASSRAVSVTYWMNRLQRLEGPEQFFVSLNPLREPAPERVLAELGYDHPILDTEAMAAQAHLERLQGHDRIWLCGSYFGYGFHEDALRSGIAVAQALGATPPWTRAEAPRVAPGVWDGEPEMAPS